MKNFTIWCSSEEILTIVTDIYCTNGSKCNTFSSIEKFGVWCWWISPDENFTFFCSNTKNEVSGFVLQNVFLAWIIRNFKFVAFDDFQSSWEHGQTNRFDSLMFFKVPYVNVLESFDETEILIGHGYFLCCFWSKQCHAIWMFFVLKMKKSKFKWKNKILYLLHINSWFDFCLNLCLVFRCEDFQTCRICLQGRTVGNPLERYRI